MQCAIAVITTPTPPHILILWYVLGFAHPGLKPSPHGSVFDFAAQNPLPARFPIRGAPSPQLPHLPYSTYTPYGLRLDLRTPDQTRARMARFLAWQAKMSLLTRSCVPHRPPSQPPL